MITLRILKWQDYPGLSRWPQCNHKGPYKREAERSEPEKEMVVEGDGGGSRGQGERGKIGRASCRERVCQYV